jgi:hypothetical protein
MNPLNTSIILEQHTWYSHVANITEGIHQGTVVLNYRSIKQLIRNLFIASCICFNCQLFIELIVMSLFTLRNVCFQPCGSPCSRPHPNTSVQEKPCFCILYYPLQTLLQVHPRHRTAGHDGPFVCFDQVQLKPLNSASVSA